MKIIQCGAWSEIIWKIAFANVQSFMHFYASRGKSERWQWNPSRFGFTCSWRMRNLQATTWRKERLRTRSAEVWRMNSGRCWHFTWQKLCRCRNDLIRSWIITVRQQQKARQQLVHFAFIYSCSLKFNIEKNRVEIDVPCFLAIYMKQNINYYSLRCPTRTHFSKVNKSRNAWRKMNWINIALQAICMYETWFCQGMIIKHISKQSFIMKISKIVQ